MGTNSQREQGPEPVAIAAAQLVEIALPAAALDRARLGEVQGLADKAPQRQVQQAEPG